MASFSIALKHDRHELVRLAELVERFGVEQHLPDDTLINVNLVLDEVVSNVIKYGCAGDAAGAIEVSLVLESGRLTIDVSEPKAYRLASSLCISLMRSVPARGSRSIMVCQSS